uniref:PA14 domain-containing protein n=4 Tax=Hemiselmis andersenii TaxID=464988 RepID=A0A7S0XZ63_HEMAN
MLGKKGRFDKVAATFDGVLHINSAGDYRICTVSDDGSRMFVDNKLTANNPGLHPPRRRCSTLSLASGDHSVRVEFFENYGGAAIIVQYSGPDTRNRMRLMPSSRHACDSAPVDEDSEGDAPVKPEVKPAPAVPPPMWVGGSPQGWSFLPNDRIRLNGFPLTWAAALRDEKAPTRMVRILIRSEDVYVSNSFVGVAFLATDVANLEAVVFRRAVRGQYAYVYHVVISKGKEQWSKPLRAYLPSRRDWFRVSVDLIKRRVLVNHRRVGLDLGFPQMEGTKVGVIGKGKSWDWKWLKTESGGGAAKESVKDLPVGATVSLSSVLQPGMFVRARGESTGLLTVKIAKGDVTTVEPSPKLAVSVSVNGRSFRTKEVSGTTKPKWGEDWEAPLPCRSLDDRMTFTLWDGKTKLGRKSVLVRTVEGSETKLKLRIAGKGAGGVVTVKAKFECVRMGVESAAVRGGKGDLARESSFKVVPGLSNGEDVSFESVAFPSMYLARDGDDLALARLPGRSSLEAGLVLYLYTVESGEDVDRAMNDGPDALRDTKPGAKVLVDTLSMPGGVSAHFPVGWTVDPGDKVLGVVRGIIDCRDTGKFTFKVAKGKASVFVDGKKLPSSGEVKLVKGLHDLAAVTPSGKPIDVKWEGPLTKLDSVPGWHAASLPSAASISGFNAAATFDVTKGVGKARGTVVLGLEGDPARSVRVKSNGDVWVCSIQGHMRQLATGLRAEAYAVPSERAKDGGMPDFDYIAPTLVGSSAKMSFESTAAIDKSVGSCVRPAFKQSPAPKAPGSSSAPAALCTGMRKAACKKVPSCRFETACGCIPRSCDCGESRCIKAGGKSRMRDGAGSEILASKPLDRSIGRRSHMHPECKKGAHVPKSGLGLVSKGYLSVTRPGTHRFKVLGTGLAQLWVDGQLVCDKTAAMSVAQAGLKLSKGSHRVVLMWYQGKSDTQQVSAMWRRPASRRYSPISGKRWIESRLSQRRRAYGQLYDDAERSASFVFRRALYVPPPPPPGSVGPGSKAASLIPSGPGAVASLACGSYLVAPAKDDKGRARLLGKCKSDDEATRGSKECEFVDEHGFCYKARYQSLCRAHRDQARCMTSVPSPEYKACACDLVSCKCDKAPPADHPNIMSPLPLMDDVAVLKLADAEAWKFVGARKQVVSRCRAEVEVAYVELLKRPADPIGLVHFTRKCLVDFERKAPGTPVTSVRRALKSKLPAMSPFGEKEYKDWSKARKVVIDAMRDVMLREPSDTVELHRYAVKVKQGASQANVAAILGFSDEYIKLRTDTAERMKRAEAMVATVFREVLMRQATRYEIVSYAKKIAAKTLKVSVLAKDLRKGGECRRMCGDRKTVRVLYQDILLREPDVGGWKAWADGYHRSKPPLKDMRAAFLRSSESVHLRVNLKANVNKAVRHLAAMLERLDRPRPGKGPGKIIGK